MGSPVEVLFELDLCKDYVDPLFVQPQNTEVHLIDVTIDGKYYLKVELLCESVIMVHAFHFE